LIFVTGLLIKVIGLIGRVRGISCFVGEIIGDWILSCLCEGLIAELSYLITIVIMGVPAVIGRRSGYPLIRLQALGAGRYPLLSLTRKVELNMIGQI